MTEPTHIIRIDPDGTVKRCVGLDALGMGRLEFDGMTSVVTLRHPMLDPTYGVGVIHDNGLYVGLPINAKGWALYGRSPIVGPIFVKLDVHSPLPEEFIEAVEDDDFPPEFMRDLMNGWLRDNDVDNVYRWPS